MRVVLPGAAAGLIVGMEIQESYALQDGSVVGDYDGFVANQIANALPPNLFSAASGTALALDGQMPVAAMVANSLRNGRYGAGFFARPSLLGPTHPYLRYLLEVPVRGLTLGAGVASIAWASGGTDLLSGTVTGMGWRASNATAGRWEPIYRTISGGGLTALANGPVFVTAGYQRLGLRYVEGPIPRMEWLVNGTVVASVTGEASVPRPFAAGAGVANVARIDAGAGTTYHMALGSRYRAEAA